MLSSWRHVAADSSPRPRTVSACAHKPHGLLWCLLCRAMVQMWVSPATSALELQPLGFEKNWLQFSHIYSNKAFTLLCLLLGKTHQGQRKNTARRFFPAASGSWCLTEVTPAGKALLPLTSVLWPQTGSTGRVLRVARGLFVKWSMTHTNGLLFVLLYSANIAFNDEVFAKWSWTHPKQDPGDKTKTEVIPVCLPRGTDQCPLVWA